MVNKLAYGAHLMRPIITIILLLITFHFTYSQNLSKYYTSKFQEKGILYFIKPIHKFQDDSNKGSFTFDLTHLSSTNSVTFNYSFTSNALYKIDSLELHISGIKITSLTTPLFTEPDKKNWKHRYTSTFTFNELKTFFGGDKPAITLYTQNGEIPLTCKPKNWEKQSGIVQKIFSMIEVNR